MTRSQAVQGLFDKLLKQVELAEPASQERIEVVQQQVGFHFSQEYRDFLLFSNGAEGPIGEHGYIQLWALEDLVEFNLGYAVQEFAPGIFLFGSDGGDEAFGFDLRDPGMPVIRIPFIPMSNDLVVQIAPTFIRFLAMQTGIEAGDDRRDAERGAVELD